MAHAIFESLNYQVFSSECETLSRLQTRGHGGGDKLAVVVDKPNRFVISEGGWTQAFKRTVFNCLCSGDNRETVVAHFEGLWKRVETIAQQLKAQPNYKDCPQTRVFAKQLDLVATRVSDVEFSYRSVLAFPKDDTCHRLCKLYGQFAETSEWLNRTLNIDKLSRGEIPYLLPEGQTVVKTVELAKSCMVSTRDKVVAVASMWIAILVGTPLLLPLAVAKWIFWNPLEWLIRGKITTQSPVAWLWHNAELPVQRHSHQNWRFRQYTDQLLHAPVITEEHVDAFQKLASESKMKIEEINLFYASTHQGKELHFIDRPVLLKLIRSLNEMPNCRRVVIPGGLCVAKDLVAGNPFPWDRIEKETLDDLQSFLVVDEALQKMGFRKSYEATYIR